MARLVTLQTLQTRTLSRAHMGTASGSKLALSTELNDNINEGIAEFYDLILSMQDQPYYKQSVTFNTVSGKDTYSIGAGQDVPIFDFAKGLGVDIFFGQQIVRTARPFTWRERNRYKYTSGWLYTQPVAYRFMGKNNLVSSSGNDSIMFVPLPSGQFQITLHYYPTPPYLVQLTDNFDGINGYEEHVVLTSAIKLLMKQEQFEHVSVLQAELARQTERIMASLGSHDADEPPRVQDTRFADPDDGAYGPAVY
jgi:hypothetical protein